MEEECADDCCRLSRVGRTTIEKMNLDRLFSVLFTIFFVLNLVLWANGSSAAIPFTTFIALLALWFCIATPLVFVGAYLGFKRPVSLSDPARNRSHNRTTRLDSGKSGSHESNSSSSSRTDALHETRARHSHGWYSPIRLYLHPIVLHSEQYLVIDLRSSFAVSAFSPFLGLINTITFSDSSWSFTLF